MKNIALITVDCLRADHVGAYGYDRPTTPNIDSLVKKGAVFQNSYANCPGTRWALQTIHTGQYTKQVPSAGIPESVRSLAEIYSEAGYATAGFAYNGFLSHAYGYDSGFDTFVGVDEGTENKQPLLMKLGRKLYRNVSDTAAGRAMKNLYHFLYSRGGGSINITDEDICDMAIEWIDEQEEPFFIWVHLMDAHTPYIRDKENLRTLGVEDPTSHTPDPNEIVTVDGETPNVAVDSYDSGIRRADEQIGRLASRLGDDTAICITGDHGEQFGEFAPFHEASLHSTFVQVPIVFAGVTAETRTDPAQHIDLGPTLLDLADIEIPDHWSGSPLFSMSNGEDDPIYFQIGDTVDFGEQTFDLEYGVRQGEWKLIKTSDGFELYNVAHMGTESENLLTENGAQIEERFEELRDMVENFEQYLSDNVQNIEVSKGLEESVTENLKQLGYLEE